MVCWVAQRWLVAKRYMGKYFFFFFYRKVKRSKLERGDIDPFF